MSTIMSRPGWICLSEHTMTEEKQLPGVRGRRQHTRLMNWWRPGRRRWSCVPGLLRGIGPELVSAASDNDPTNVGTAAAVGA